MDGLLYPPGKYDKPYPLDVQRHHEVKLKIAKDFFKVIINVECTT